MERWCFIHIMKTAGTSFRSMLEESGGAEVYPTRDELRARPNGWYAPATELLEGIGAGRTDIALRRFVCGHYAASLAAALPGSWRTVTFLRDPVRRSLSMIAHRHKRARRINRYLKPRIARYLDDPIFVERQVRDYQTKIFALDAEADVNGSQTVDDAGFARAKERLLAADFVGLTESFASSIRLFEAMSGLRLGEPPHRNKSPDYSATPADIARIRALVAYDIELYEIAHEKLRRQLAAA